MASATLTAPLASSAGQQSWLIRLFPSLTDLVFLLPTILIFLKSSGLGVLLQDADTGWHIRTGEWILQHRAVPKVDLFSFTRFGQPWYAWEWGWDVLFALIHKVAGLAGVAFFNLLILSFISLLLYKLVCRVTGNELLSVALTVIAMQASTVHWLARPHLLSWLLILAVLHILLSVERGRVTLLWILPPLTLLWTNLHGSFFIGVVFVLTSGLGRLLTELRKDQLSRPIIWRATRPYLLCASACLAISLANPYTWHLHQHVISYLSDKRLIDLISEYHSVNFRESSSAFFELMLLLGTAAALWCLLNQKYIGFLSNILWAHLALVSVRNIPVFLFVATPWIALMVQALLSRVSSVAFLNKLRCTGAEIASEFQHFERIGRSHLLSVLITLLIGWLSIAKAAAGEVGFSPRLFPQKAIRFAGNGSGRIFTTDQWGDYLIYQLYPSVRVFVDGRSDFYGPEMAEEFLKIMNGHYDCEQQLKKFSVSTVIISPAAPLASVLKATSRWQVLMDDGSVIVFRAQPDRNLRGPKVQRSLTVSPVPLNGERSLLAPKANEFVVSS